MFFTPNTLIFFKCLFGLSSDIVSKIANIAIAKILGVSIKIVQQILICVKASI